MRNQQMNEWIERVIKNEVLTCQSSLVEKLLENGIVEHDEIVNQYIDNSDKIEEIEEEIEKLEDEKSNLESAYDDLDDAYAKLDENDEEGEKAIRLKMDANEQEQKALEEKIEELEEKKEKLEDEQSKPQEVMEWWVVSSWLANHLEEMGEVLLKSDYETWWGRTCSGQSISLDHTMEELYNKVNNK